MVPDETKPMPPVVPNRRARRYHLKRTGMFPAASLFPTYLGIKRFKRAVRAADRREGVNSFHLITQYKDNAWQSLRELNARREAEAERAAKKKGGLKAI